MSRDEKIENYFQSIVKSFEFINNKDKDNLIKMLDSYKTKEILGLIIDAGNDYLLTPGFINYVVSFSHLVSEYTFYKMFYRDLMTLVDLNNSIKTIMIYLDFINGHPDYNNIRTSYENELLDIFNNTLGKIPAYNYLELKDFFIRKDIFLVILSYVIINRKDIKEFYTFIEPYLNHWDTKLDEMKLQFSINIIPGQNSYEYNRDVLRNYIISQINNTVKEIR